MRNFYDLKVNQYNLRSNYLLKLPAKNTCRYGMQALYFKGILFWNNIQSKSKNINTPEEFKTQIKLRKVIIWSCRN